MDDEKKSPDAGADGLSDGRWLSPFSDLLRAPGWDGAPPEPPDAAPTIGTPQEDSAFFPGVQSYQDTCAIRCQEFILEQFTGADFSEDQLVRESYEHGWYVPSQGTPQEDVGKLLELHGVPVQSYQNATVFHLAQELGQGHKVIISVDSGELWGNSVLESVQDRLGLRQADHAVVVSGIDTSDPGAPHVIVSDPGTGQAAARYPLDQFLDAWADSNFHMVATREPAPSHLPEMAHFDYGAGHIPEVAGMPWEEFETFESRPEEWDEQFEAERARSHDEGDGHDEGAAGHEESAGHDEGEGYRLDLAGPGAEADAPGAEFQTHLDEVGREAYRHDLSSLPDPDAFTNRYDD